MDKRKGVSVFMAIGRKNKTWKTAAGVAVGLAVLLAASLFSPGSYIGGKRGVPGVGLQGALAGDFSGGGLGDNYVLGLFSRSIGGILKVKIPSSERVNVRNVRLFVDWSAVEGKSKGSYSWYALDTEINNTLSLGVNSILLTISGRVPNWARNPANPKSLAPPRNMKDWGDFCRAVAARYRNYVDYYQIWQEPGWDLDAPPAAGGKVYYADYCDYSYMGMMRSGYQGIKSADPTSYVFTGSLINGLTRTQGDLKNYEILLAGGNQDVSMKITSGSDIVAERPMYFNYGGKWTGGNVELGVKQPGKTWYLAEGATHPGFEEWICIQNPQSSNAGVTITYMFPGGATQDQQVTVKAKSRYTVNVNAAVGPDKNVSARVKSTMPVVVERPMYFNYYGKWAGGSIGAGVPALSKKWYLAEGATQPGFEEWISLMNPNAVGSDVKITYMFPGGATQVQHVAMAKTSRETVKVNDIVGPNKDVSAMVESTQPIIAERPMYFLYGNAWPGGHTQFGAVAPATSWFLAEGTTRNNASDGSYEEWISVMNPGGTTAKVDLTYMFGGGATQVAHKTVAPHSRETINVNSAVGPDKDVSVRLNSNEPIVVERPMYYNYANRIPGGDVELGCTQAGRTWYFAEGTTREGFEEWLTLQNPLSAPTTATIEYMFADGTTQKQDVGLPANSRTTVGINRSLSIATICDALAVHPYDYPENWTWYYQSVKNVIAKNGYAGKELAVTEIGWPHYSDEHPFEYSPEKQRRAIGEVGVGGLWGAGCRKIWIFEDVDPPPKTSWDSVYDGLYDHNGNPMPAWNEYKKWQSQLPNYGNKPSHMP